MNQINASIVLYHNKAQQLKKAILSLLGTSLHVKIYLLDNSSSDSLRYLSDIDNRVEYIFNNANLGYGKAHNIAIRQTIKDNIGYHLVLNPDIYFKEGVLEKLFAYMENHKDTGNVMPQVLYPNGDTQYLCKLLPTPLDLFFRRFVPLKKWKEKRNKKFELRLSGYDKIMNVPSLSGCFMFLRIDALKQVGIFDENIFMYLEDIDLNRRIHDKYKTIFYPEVEIFHEYGKESYRDRKLLKYHIYSAIYYFNKWGWVLDGQRREVNKKTLSAIKKDMVK